MNREIEDFVYVRALDSAPLIYLFIYFSVVVVGLLKPKTLQSFAFGYLGFFFFL